MNSVSTSSEIVTTIETVRVDTAATRLVVIAPLGAVVSAQTFPVPFAHAAVQAAVATGTTSLQTGSPESLFVKGPTLVGVRVNGPLGAATLDTAKEVELCIPSTAVLP